MRIEILNILEHPQGDTLAGLVWPRDPELWKTHVAPLGALKAALEEDVTRPAPLYLTDDERKRMVEALLSGGFTGPTSYYKVQVRGFNSEDELCMYSLTHPHVHLKDVLT